MPPRPRFKAPSLSSLDIFAPPPIRPITTSFQSSRISRHRYSTATGPPATPPSRWQAELKARIGRCVMFGCSESQIQRAAKVLRALATEWRALAAGSEGFLTGGRRGLEGHAVAWGEMDSFQHVNNINYLRYAETSRVNWITYFACIDPTHGTEWRDLMRAHAIGIIMKSIKADYKFPMTYPDSVSVYHKLRSLPSPTDTSLILECVIMSHNHRRVAARTEEEAVVYDYRAGRKTTMPHFVFEVFERTWRQQEEELRRARTRIWELINEVECLEKETWDREDAVEDFGSAGTSSA